MAPIRAATGHRAGGRDWVLVTGFWVLGGRTVGTGHWLLGGWEGLVTGYWAGGRHWLLGERTIDCFEQLKFSNRACKLLV
ncbi:MAG: hypothetical protein EP299_00130 [Acidobacteria bacterium]|nr:MAG: hypothetical protein EP299_00130 [Acidobacteriota bacterium]